MARKAQVSVGTVHALWQANDIKPHLTGTFKLSNDPQFETKFWDISRCKSLSVNCSSSIRLCPFGVRRSDGERSESSAGALGMVVS